jgi:mono/diheme cytochrome c family protein
VRTAFAIVAGLCLMATSSDAEEGAGGRKEQVERGRYLAEHVAMCIECHTPRDDQGVLIRSEAFHGAPIPVRQPVQQQQGWALRAPNIAGLPQYDTAAGVRLLTEGIARGGKPPSPPMPPFRMTRADAEAVVAFLKSLE